MPAVFKRSAARLDLVERYVYLAEHSGTEVAERFLHNAESSFADLSEYPLIGAPIILRSPLLAGLRKWRIKEFDETLIFYLPRNNGISVVRVLNAAQDWWSALGL